MTSWIKGTQGESQVPSKEDTLRSRSTPEKVRAERGEGVGHGEEGVITRSCTALCSPDRVYSRLTWSAALPKFNRLPRQLFLSRCPEYCP